MIKNIKPKLSVLTPREKAQDILGRKNREDAIKEITQLMYLLEDDPIFNEFWQNVLNQVVLTPVKKAAGYIG